MGWLHSRPKLHDKDNEARARIENLQDGDPLLELPECDSFIANAWHEMGMCLSGGYGSVPLPYTEIKAYSDSVAELDSFEVSIIAKMSRLYVSEKSAATAEVSRPAPHEGVGNLKVMRNNVAEKLKAMFSK